jgi:hypothetical protein
MTQREETSPGSSMEAFLYHRPHRQTNLPMRHLTRGASDLPSEGLKRSQSGSSSLLERGVLPNIGCICIEVLLHI